MVNTVMDYSIIEERKKFLTDFWEGKSRRFAYRIMGWTMPDYKPTQTFKLGEQFKDPDKLMAVQSEPFDQILKIEHDDIPALMPYLGTGVFASAFGCNVEFPENEQPWTKPVVYKADDVHKLTKPEVTSGLLSRVIEITKYFMKKSDPRIPIRVTDVQGPIDTASLVWHYDDFLTAMYTDKKEVHMLLEMITNLIIEFVKLQKSILKERFLPNHCPGFWVPPDWGISISDDLAAIVSPNLYKEFSVPYNERLAKAFGRLHIHSCGDFSFNLDNIVHTSGVKSVDFAVTECPIDKVVEKLGNKVVLVPRWGLNKNLHFKDTIEYLDYTFDGIKGVDPEKLFITVEKGSDNKTGEYREIQLEEVYSYLSKPR